MPLVFILYKGTVDLFVFDDVVDSGTHDTVRSEGIGKVAHQIFPSHGISFSANLLLTSSL